MPRVDNVEAYAKASTSVLLNTARNVVEKEIEKTQLFEDCEDTNIPRFHANEMVLGRVVGRGGFCVVRELCGIKLRCETNGTVKKEMPISSRWNPRKINRGSRMSSCSSVDSDISSREYLARRVWSNGGSGKYVVKQLEGSFVQTDKVTFLKGIIDLALEAKYLENLNHPHILKLRGICYDGPFTNPGFFLVLDHLQETLPKRLNSWMHATRATKGVTGFITGGKRKVNALLTDRLLVAYDIAEAMDYLHQRPCPIIFRDLKPNNIGFAADGVLKLFDFGLAKELMSDEQDEDGLYRMTKLTGGIRYMAPEVGLGLPYNLKADVYSWSMLMWYILALEPPMGMYTPDMFIDRVFQKGYRPAIMEKWSPGLSDLLRSSWSKDINVRPTFREIMLELREELKSIDPHIASFLGDRAEQH